MDTPTAGKLADAGLVEQYARSQAALEASEERLRLAMEAADLGTWDWDIANDRVSWSDAVYRLHGVTRDGFGGGVADFAAIVHDDDRPRVQQQIEAALADDTPYATEFRVVWPDGTIRWLSTRAHLVRDAAGAPKRMVGATYDVTERVQLLAAERAARAEAESARQRLELLASASTILSGTLQPGTTLLRLAEILTPRIADWCRIDLLDGEGELVRGLAYHADPERTRVATTAVKRLRRPVGDGRLDGLVHSHRRLVHRQPRLARGLRRHRRSGAARVRANDRHALALDHAADRARPHPRRARRAAGRVGPRHQRRRRGAARRHRRPRRARARQRAALFRSRGGTPAGRAREPRQGRVPGDARPRAAQPAGADRHHAQADGGAGRQPVPARAAPDRTPGSQSRRPGRRPARRRPHRPRRRPLAQGTRRPRRGADARRRDRRPACSRAAATSCASCCRLRPGASMPTRAD